MHRPSWVSDELFPFPSRFVDVSGHRVHYVDEGSGPLLLMLHGNPTWSFAYREVILALRDRFRCVALDYPGFGLSEAAPGYRFSPEEHAAVVSGFLEQLDLRDVTIFLHDWGGPIGLAAAQRHPDRVAGLVVGNTWAWPVNGDLHFELFARGAGGPVGRELARRVGFHVNVMLPMGHRRRRLTDAELSHYREPLRTRERRQATAVLPGAILSSRRLLADLEAGLPRFAPLPALVVWADRDVAFRDQERLRWRRHLPRAHEVVVHGAGHYLQSDAPAEVAAAVRDWWPRRHERDAAAAQAGPA